MLWQAGIKAGLGEQTAGDGTLPRGRCLRQALSPIVTLNLGPAVHPLLASLALESVMRATPVQAFFIFLLSVFLEHT